MELKWIEDFLSLAETRSFSRSAEARAVTQSASTAITASTLTGNVTSSAVLDKANVITVKGSFEVPKSLHHFGLFAFVVFACCGRSTVASRRTAAHGA